MSLYFKQSLFTLLFLIFINSVYAQADGIDVFVQQEMQQRKIPGLQLAIVQNGKIIKAGNYGLANVQDSIPVSDKTVFSINSITKAFTGVAILQLVEAGKLNLSSRFLNTWKNYRKAGNLLPFNNCYHILPAYQIL